jgi:hypothetical protein
MKLSEIEEKIKEWLKGPEEKEVPPPALPYQEKLVAFIDILGISDKVEKGGYDSAEIVDIMNKIRTYVDSGCSPLSSEGRLNSLQIGDGYFIIVDFDCVDEICKILSVVQWQILVYSHMLLRGALTAGGVAIGDEEEYFIGPAIIEVLKLEREIAIFPRIVVNNKEIEKYIEPENIKYKYIVEDQDKIKYLDYIKYHVDNEKLTVEKLEEFLKKNEVNKTLKEAYEKYIGSNKREAQKYGWLISKFATHGIKII